MDQFSHPEIENLMKLEENKSCFDCGNKFPRWASLNNGVLVCIKCSGIHRSFGIRVSFIRSLQIDSWDDKQIEFLKRGGNKRFKELLEEYKVPDNATMDFKYMIRASDYYRQLLKSEVETSEPPIKPDAILGLEMLEYGNYQNLDFHNQTPICSSQIESVKPRGFFDKVGGFLNVAKEQIKSTAHNVAEKVKELEIPEKLKETGQKSFDLAKTTGQFVVEKGKEVISSELVQNFANKTEEGINIIIAKTKKILRDDEESSTVVSDSFRSIEDTTHNYTIAVEAKNEEQNSKIEDSQEVKCHLDELSDIVITDKKDIYNDKDKDDFSILENDDNPQK